MATKSDILNNLREYTADQIVEAIKDGTVTVYELSKSGDRKSTRLNSSHIDRSRMPSSA